MFGNLTWYNVVLLLLLALFIFGERLPQMISDGLRLLRSVRRMAQNATTDLSRELGTDIQLEDLHPKTFIRKHVLSEADQDALVRPLKGISEDVRRQATAVSDDMKAVGRGAKGLAKDVQETTDLSASGGTSTPAVPARPRLDDVT